MFPRLSSLILIIVTVAIAGCGSAASGPARQAAQSRTASSVLGASALPSINPPAYLPGPLNGLSTPRALGLRRPLGVIIENYDPDSRPQSGLTSASTVIETLAEGGITRFMAIYLEKDASKVGPVRSTRMYFDRWAQAFHAILTHVGGNDDAQAALWHMPKVFNIDENRWEVNLYNTGTYLFWRSQDRVAPHNMYVNTTALRRYADQHGQDWAYTQAYFPHKSWASLKQRGHSGSIDITWLDPLNPRLQPGYDVHYQFNRATDTYARDMGGAPHVDALTGHQLRPSNVVVMKTGNAVFDPNAGVTPESLLIPVVGKGRAIYFRDGVVRYGTWQQANQWAPLRFYDSRGRLVAFNPGQTWIEAVPASSSVTWSFR